MFINFWIAHHTGGIHRRGSLLVFAYLGEAPFVLLPLFERGLNSRHFQTRLRSDTGEIMNTGSSKSLGSRAWRDLYKAALFEVDKTRLPHRIAQAEEALVVRARELFHIAGDDIEEEQALD